MRLVRFGASLWTVLCICDARDRCAVLEFIDELDEKRGNKVFSDLREYVPVTNPRDWVACDFSKELRDGIFEFRWPTKGGGTPRVLWFYDANRVVVCTHGINKKGDMSDEEIDRAEQRRRDYLAAKEAGQIIIVEIDALDGDCE